MSFWKSSEEEHDIYLQVVVLKNFHQRVSQIRNLHAFLNTMNQKNGVNVSSNIVQQTSNESCEKQETSKLRKKIHPPY